MATRKRKVREEQPLRRTCGTMAAHMRLLEEFPSFRERQFKIERAFALRRGAAEMLDELEQVTIGVIVNVVYNTEAQNVSDAQIRTQLDVLNKDFAATNSDRSQVPPPWKGLVTDSKIAFAIENVTRTRTRVASFTDDDGVKFSSTGGIAPSQPTRFLNIWVCPLSGGLLGYAQFPGGPTATDGVVVNYRAFGTVGTAEPPFQGGRTTTHEVGHYFNLRHIWGDTEDCSGSDMVADTPNCAGPNYGTPRFPIVTCNNGPNGDMFMNYMDYVDDSAMFMFTAQQVLRMRSTLDGPRSGLK